MSWIRRNVDIIFIILIGFSLRMTGAVLHSYSNDELSAVSRLRYTSFSDLIDLGVEKGDMHPAGVQVFMKIWSLGFGKGEWSMRLPFILLSIGAILLLFLLGQRWFNRKVGLIAAGLLAVLYFSVLNSEFARPYSFGLFFTILVGYQLYRLLKEESISTLRIIALSIGFAGAMYSHYFAFFFVIFMGFTGLFLLKKTTWKAYFLSALIALVLFAPHIPVTIYHLQVGGLQWLAPPESDWLLHFVFHSFNESWTVIIVLAVAIVYGWWKGKNGNKISFRKWSLAAVWFFGIYLIGHVYSYIGTPILKFPVMLFAFPYLLLLIAIPISRIPSHPYPMIGMLLVVLVSTVQEKKYVQNVHFALFKEPGIKMANWQKTYGAEHIYTIYNLNNPEYINFYKEEWGGEPLNFNWSIVEYGDDYLLYETLQSRPEEYCVIGFSSRNTLVQAFETVLHFYPQIVDYERYNNGSVFLLKKAESHKIDRAEEVLATFDTYKKIGEWVYDESLTKQVDETGSHYQLDGEHSVGPKFKFQEKDLPQTEGYIKVNVSGVLPPEAGLTISFTATRDGASILHQDKPVWIGHDQENMMRYHPEHYSFFAFKVPTYILPDDNLSIQLWNRTGDKIEINFMEIVWVENIWNPPFLQEME